jgi:hypothetical protein
VHNHMLDDEPRMIYMHFWGLWRCRGFSQGLEGSADADWSVKEFDLTTFAHNALTTVSNPWALFTEGFED